MANSAGQPLLHIDDATLGRMVRKSMIGLAKAATTLQQTMLGGAALGVVAIATELNTPELQIDLECIDPKGSQSIRWKLQLKRVE